MQTNMPSNLQANIEQARLVPDKQYTKCYIEAITFNLSNKDKYLWNDMIILLSANFAQVSTTQTEFWCNSNYQIEPKTNKGKCETKRHKMMPAMQQTSRNRYNKAWLAQNYELRTYYVKNTTSVSSCDLEQVTLEKYV